MKYDLSKYRRSLKLVKDLDVMVPKIQVLIKELEDYKHYAPIREILLSLRDNLTILEIHQNKERRVKTTKGEES